MRTRREILRQAATAGLWAATAWAHPSAREGPTGPGAFQASPGIALDAHLHLTSAALAGFLRGRQDGEGEETVPVTAADAVAVLDATGVGRAFALSGAYRFAADFPAPEDDLGNPPSERQAVQAENDFLARQCARHPARLLPFCSLNPKRQYAVAEIERCATQLSCRGLKLHLWNSDVNLRRPEHRARVRAALATASAHGMAVIVHLFNGEVTDFGPEDVRIFVERILAGLPSLAICFSHLGGAGGYDVRVAGILDELIRVREGRPPEAAEMFVDLAAVFLDGESELPSLLGDGRSPLGGQLQAWGLESVLWGSDNVEGYAQQCRRLWPLGDDALGQVFAGDGSAFLSRLAGREPAQR